MRKRKPCHCLLTVPNELRAKQAEQLASNMFKRVLASWAQDLLRELQKDGETASTRIAA